jgi:hypothetical protein
MTEQHVINPLSIGVDYPTLAARFRPIFQRIAEGSVEREHTRALPYEPIQWLKQAGFGAVRVPVEYGGGGASLPQLFELLIELAAADSNVPQALRGPFAFAEDRLNGATYGSSALSTAISSAAPGPKSAMWPLAMWSPRSAPTATSGSSTVKSSTAPAACSRTGSTCTPSAAIPAPM